MSRLSLELRPTWPRAIGIFFVGITVLAALAAALAPTLFPAGAEFAANAREIATIAIFVGSYVGLAIGRIPGLNIDRAGIALVGAALMILCGAVSLEESYQSVDFDTITLLLGMMILVASLRLSGFFSLVTFAIGSYARKSWTLLVSLVVATGFLSAIFVNDAICLVLAPLVIELTRALGLRPVPYLLAVALASNVGSAATIIGNPQNIMIGSFSGIPFVTFTANIGPVALIGLAITALLVFLMHRRDFGESLSGVPPTAPVRIRKALAFRALIATAMLVVAFVVGASPAKAAITVGSLLLLTRRIKTRRIYEEIDWSLLLMFVGLFIIVAGAQHVFLTNEVVRGVAASQLQNVFVLTGATAVLSNVVSNVPAVLLVKPLILQLHDVNHGWLIVAMASTFAGNFTILGSVANLIVVQAAANAKIQITFWDYFRIGAPVTLLTLAVGALYLS